MAFGLVVVGLAADNRGTSFDRLQVGLGTAVITGDVRLSAPEGRTVAGVDVWASDSVTGIEVGRDETDDLGRFTLQVAPGRYTVSAGGRAASLEVRYGARHDDLPPAPVIVQPGERVGIHLVGSRATVLSGFVRDDRGQPISDAVVDLKPQVPASEWRKPRTNYEVGTGSDGAYRIVGVRPGAYLVFAGTKISPLPGRDSADTRNAPAPRYLPGTEYASDVAAVEVQPGEDRTNLDIMLPQQPVLDVAGAAVLADGSSFRGQLFVVARPIAGPPFDSSSYSRENGTFFLALHRTRYRLDVRAVGEPIESSASAVGREYYSRSILDASSMDSQPVKVSLAPSMRVAGRVLTGTRPLAGVGIRLMPESASPPAIREASATSDQNGLFSANGLAAGRYLIALDRGVVGGWALDTVRLRGRAVSGGVIDVDRSIAAEELELTVVPKSASLSGRVMGVDLEAASSYVVVLVSAGKDVPTVTLTRPDNAARYVFSHQTPGPYVLFLLADPEPSDIDILVDAASKRDSSNGVPVMLKTDSATALDLRIRSVAVHSGWMSRSNW